MSRRVLVDTSAWIMLLNKSEQYHKDAVCLYSNLNKNSLVVTNLIIGETYTWLRKKSGFQAAFDYLQAIKRKDELKQIETVYSDAPLEEQAVQFLEKYSDHQFSYADAVSICVMRNLKIKKIFAYDEHFIIAGFDVIS